MGEVAALVHRLGQSTGDKETFGLLQQTCVRLAPDVTSVSLALVGGSDSLHYFGLGSLPGEPHRLVGSLPLQRTAAGAAIAAKRTLCSDDPAVSGAKLEDWRGLPAAVCQSAISAPMLSNGVAIGCLSVASSRPHAFSGLQQTFSTLAAVIAPHLRLARSEKALQATQSLLRDALLLEQANASAAQQQQQQPRERVQQTGAAVADAAVAAPATPRAAHDAALRAQSTASTAADSFEAQLSAGAPAAATAAVTTAEPTTAQPLVVCVVAAASAAAGWLRALVTSSIRPAALNSTCVRAPEPGASTGKADKGNFAGRRHRGEGYAFDDYEFSSDDESAAPGRAAAMPAVAAPLGRWRGPLEFWDATAEGSYLDWACATWQAPLDIAVGSAALGHIMMLAASPNTDCIGCGLLDGGALLAVCRLLLAMLLLFGVRLMLMRRSHYVRHREWLISCARILCMIVAAARLAPTAEAQQRLAHRLRDLVAPALFALPFAAQVRFSRHLLLTAVQAAVTAAAVAASADTSWGNAIPHPAELGYAVGSVALPAAGLYLMEAAARRSFVRSHMPLHAE